MRGLLIIDGIDGSGKTSIIRLLSRKLKRLNIKTKVIHEPSNPKIIKNIAQKKDPLIEFFSFLLERAKIYKKIQQWLKRNYLIISDRGFPSTLVYQYYLTALKKRINEKVIWELNQLAMGFLKNYQVIILNLNPSLALQRIRKRDRESLISKFEKLSKLKKAQRGFLYFASKYKWKIINADQTKEEICSEIINFLAKK